MALSCLSERFQSGTALADLDAADNTAAEMGKVGVSPIDGKFVQGKTVVNGLISLEFKAAAGGDLSGKVLTMKPAESSGALIWTCGASADGTTVDAKFLPSTCKG